uniref:Uncharacterized protein n=1 Tax=Hyaloperonospora arabidopsidis (strain Emoy2) TaxID=559515 RepID=M4B4Y0_HYAAE
MPVAASAIMPKMLSKMIKQVATPGRPAHRCHSSHTKLWDLFRAPTEALKEPEAPQYIMNMKDNLEFALERMRLLGEPVALQLLDCDARRLKKES